MLGRLRELQIKDRYFNDLLFFRQEIQGLKGLNNEQYDFLSDEYITSNKPYLRLVFLQRYYRLLVFKK